MLLAVSACVDPDILLPRPAVPKSVVVFRGDAQVGMAGNRLTNPIEVTVLDTAGRAGRNVRVTFEVRNGGSLERTDVLADSTGRASAGLWRLGPKAGRQEVVVRVSTLPDLVVAATATAAQPFSLAIDSGTAQSAFITERLPNALVVVVRDTFTNPVVGGNVTFEVESGGGAVSDPVVPTDSLGRARFTRWTLGTTVGEQRLRARIGTLSASFVATARTVTGCNPLNLIYGTSYTGAWTSDDCRRPQTNRLYDAYRMNLSAQTMVRFTANAPAGSALEVRADGAATPTLGQTLTAGASTQVRAVMAAGKWFADVVSRDTTAGGTYSISAVPDTAITCGIPTLLIGGVSIDDQLTTGVDCDLGDRLVDVVTVKLNAGDTIYAELTSAVFGPALSLREAISGAFDLVSGSSGTPGTATLAFTAQRDIVCEVRLTSFTARATGKYNIKIRVVKASG